MNRILKALILSSAIILLPILGACTKEEQVPEEEIDVELSFSVNGTEASEATITISPSDGQTPYYWSVMPENIWASLEGTEAIQQEDMDYFGTLAEKLGISTEEVIGRYTVSGEITETVKDLVPQTNYIVYGYGLTKTSASDMISSATFTTGQEQPQETPVKISVSVENTGMTTIDATYTPENQDVLFFPDCVSEDDLFVTGEGTEETIMTYFNETLEYSAEMNNMTTFELISQLWKKGTFKTTWHYLDPSSKYYVYGIELDTEGNVLGMDYQEASTTERVLKDVTFTIEFPQLSYNLVEARITPSDTEQKYYAAVFEKSDFESAASTDEEFMQLIVDSYGENMEELVYTGVQSGYFQGLPDDSDMIAIAFAYDETWVSKMTKVEFHTKRILDPEELTFDFDLMSLTSFQIIIGIIPNGDMVPFHYSYMKKEDFDKYSTTEEAVQAGFDTYIQKWVDYYDGEFTREEVIYYLTRYNARTYTETQLEPDTEYYIWAGSFTEDGVLISTPSTFYFKTDEWVASDVTVTPYARYFYGGDIRPYYEGVWVSVVDSVKAVGTDHWLIGWFKGDYTDVEEYPDYFIAQHLYMGGRENLGSPEEQEISYGEFGTWTFLAIGIEDGPTDEDDLYGVPYRELVNITPETCSPSDEFPWDILDPDQFSLDCPQGMGALAMDDDMEYNANNNIPTTSRSAVSESGSKPGGGYYMTTGQDTDNPALSESLLKKASREEMLKSQKVRFLYRIR